MPALTGVALDFSGLIAFVGDKNNVSSVCFASLYEINFGDPIGVFVPDFDFKGVTEIVDYIGAPNSVLPFNL